MDLSTAGMISGAGNAGTQALSNLQTTLGTSFLQQERDKLETARLELHNEYMTQRDTTAYNRGRADLTESRAYAEGAPGRAMTQDEQLQPRKSALASKTFQQEKPMREEAAREDIANEVTKATLLAENKAWIKAQAILSSAKESSASKAQAAKTMFDLERGKKGAKLQDDYITLAGTPDADPAQVSRAREAWTSFATKPGESEKIDASNAAVGLKEAGNEIVRLQAMMEAQLPGTPGYIALERRLKNAELAHEAYDARVRELTGAKPKPAPPRTEDLSSLDPWQTSPLSKKAAPDSSESSVPAERAGVLATPNASAMRPRTLDEALGEAGGSVNLPRASSSGPSLQDVRAYIDAQGTSRESAVRNAYLKRYGKPPTQSLLSQLQREAKGGG